MSKQFINKEKEYFFTKKLSEVDPEVFKPIEDELERQQNTIELIASENITSFPVMNAQGSIFTNKYAEGYPGKRYYGGCEHADTIETIALERAKKLFKCNYANVQPNSGSQANQAVFLSLIKPNDTILGLSLAAGGHLTHGAAPNQSGRWFNSVQYGVRKEDATIDYEEVRALAQKHKPKLIITGFSAYSKILDWKKFRDIADEVGAYLLADIAHIAGLVAAGVYPSPIDYADVVTTTTHKTLRGPRGGIILSNFGDKVIRKTKSGKEITLKNAINSSIFPGIQGGPLMHVIAGKAVALGEALKPEFQEYAKSVVKNAKILAKTLQSNGIDIVGNGTDCHIVLVDLRSKSLTGKQAEESLERAGLTCNKNAVPFDPESPFITSGIRLGTPAGTTRGFGEEEFERTGTLISKVLNGLSENKENNSETEQEVLSEVKEICNKFPIYNNVGF